MRERPILFSGPMVGAILRGEKTVTRRVVKWPLLGPSDGRKRRVFGPDDVAEINTGNVALCPYGRAGDRLWVRETFAANVPGCDFQGGYSYRADHLDPRGDGPTKLRWKPGIHMPRTASRLTLEVVSVRVEELHAITEEEAVREGLPPRLPEGTTLSSNPSAAKRFTSLWETINGRGSWAKNPWVWRIEFRRVEVKP
jgi:hypothetical protein